MAEWVEGDQPKKKKSKIEFEESCVIARDVKMQGEREKIYKFKDNISNALKYITSVHGPNFCFVKFIHCNGAFSCSFSHAWCATIRHIEEVPDNEIPFVAAYGDLFNLDIIREYFHTYEDAKEKMSLEMLIAMKKLTDFYEGIGETRKLLELQEEKVSDEAWCVILVNHVLGKLAVAGNVTVSDCGYTGQIKRCPCGCLTPVKCGDTSIGNKAVWHGSVDVLIGPVAVLCYPRTGKLEDQESECNSAFELKTGNLEIGRNQLIAETVVFAFVQNMLGYNVGLVPTIAISLDTVKVYMYDPIDDLLYESTELPLFSYKEGKQLDKTTVFALWLAINYVHFCTGAKRSHIELGFKSEFQSVINDDNKLEIYRKYLRVGGCKHAGIIKRNYKQDIDVKILP